MLKINLSKIKLNRIYFLIVVLTFVVYGNSINNEYAMDDNLVTEGVAKVEEGFSGIPEIFTTPMTSGKQTYGYRPLVQATFAIEKQLFKKLPVKQTLKEKERKDKLTQANISHFINVLLYAFLCIVLFSLLSELFQNFNLLLPVTVTLLFLVHPLHTEAVDNLKSRDELLMLLSMLLSLKYYLKFADKLQLKHLLYASLFVLLARFSKINAIALVGLVPVILYFQKSSVKSIVISTSSVLAIFACFILIKQGLVSEVSTRDFKYFENPLKSEGSFMNRITTGLYSSWFYFEMLIFPKNLSFYYGYNQIPLTNWTYWQVWMSLLFYVPLGIYGFWRFLKREVIGLGIVIWGGVMIGIINVFFPIVGIVADRFAFTFSIGFCIVLGYLILKVFKIDLERGSYKVNLSSSFVLVLVGVLTVYSARAIARNPDWHDQLTLYNHDIEHLTESAKAHALLANVYYPILSREVRSNPNNPKNKANIEKLIFHYKEAIRIDSTYLTSINNLGSVYMNFLSDYDNTIYYCEKAVSMDENYLEAQYNLGTSYNAKGDVNKSLYHYSRVIEINPNHRGVYQVFNELVNKHGKVRDGIEILKNSAKKVENPKNIYVNIGNLYSLDNYNVTQSIVYFVKAYEIDPTDKQLCGHIVNLYNSLGQTAEANNYLKLCSN